MIGDAEIIEDEGYVRRPSMMGIPGHSNTQYSFAVA